jgi:tetratricopeptide (TPR) repeat protein
VRAASDAERYVRLQAAYALREWQPAGDAEKKAEDVAIIAALADWEASARATLDRPTGLHNLGNFLIAQQRFEEGVEAYRRALRFEPRAVAPRHNLAMFLAGQGRLEEAEVEFETVLRHNPDASATAFSLGLLFGQRSRWPDAIRAFDLCVTHEPGYPRAYYNLGLAHSKAGDIPAALENLTKAAETPGSRSSAAQVLVGIYRQLGEPEQSSYWSTRLAALRGQE